MSAGAGSPRAQLLAALVDRAAHGGLADVSLRQLAVDIGTSHRMLLYHFESREGLLAAVAAEVERAQRDAVAQLRAVPGLQPREVAWQMWQRFADPSLWPAERLFFELYAQALQGHDYGEGFLDSVLEPWFALVADMLVAQGVPADRARTHARLGVAVVRGLLLDLLATRDRAGVDAAMATFLDWYERGVGSPHGRPG